MARKRIVTSKRGTLSNARAKTRVTREEVVENFTQDEPQEQRSFSLRIRKSYIVFLLILAAVIGILYYFKGLFIVATVNGQPITRLAVIGELEKRGGNQAVDSLITRELIQQEGKRQNVSVTEKEMDDEIKKLEESLGGKEAFEQLLQLQGLSRSDLKEQVRMQKLVEKMLAGQIQVTEKEVDEYIEKNKETLLKNTTDSASLKTNVTQQLKQQKLSEKLKPWLDSLKQKAKIRSFLSY